MTRTLREHLQIHKKLSKAMFFEAGVMAVSLCLKSVANKFFFAIFMLALLSFVLTFIASFIYRNYLKSKFGKSARRVFFSIEAKNSYGSYGYSGADNESHLITNGRSFSNSFNSTSHNSQNPFSQDSSNLITSPYYSNVSGNIYHRD